ncbi:uncharacterized protein LOC130665545 [Microplitis mediator]|uniref:uncharacterized protein LOC130665545 n=1 Tax=Microplitis mediator TaxID=375433 RepID=UPI00255563A7|nr:uncharacterized protein LOC130665545 [Microplitis mediator]XP_057321972.1 uncharacterized protein LOC130665545 [Microplitis mediator]
MLEDGLQMVVNEITKNKENGSQPNRRPINHPPLNNNAEVQVTPDFSMPYKMYLQALHAPDMRKRAVRVMHVLWNEEWRGKLLVEATRVGNCVYMALQEIKFIECRQKDGVIAYLRDWTSVWLKNWKPQKKAKRQSNRRT